MEYTTLSIDEVTTGLEQVARDARATFGSLDSGQLNWRPEPERWSVGQCLEHLLVANRLMLQAMEVASQPGRSATVWERLPVLPGVLGRALIRSQAPSATRKFKAAPPAQPSASDVPPDVLDRFVAQHREAVVRAQQLDARAAARIMTSPFIRVVTYSVLDGWRLILAHDHRHVEQARRVTATAGFPR